MAASNAVSLTRVRAYWDCPRLYKLRYLDRLVVERQKPPLLVLGDLVHRALARYHTALPRGERGVVECVQRAAKEAMRESGEAAVRGVCDEAVALVLGYHRAGLGLIGPRCRCEVPLSAQVGPLQLYARADAVWVAGEEVLGEADWKLSLPSLPLMLAQAAFIHAGLRAQWRQGEIRHYVIVLRPQPQVRAVPLEEASYREVLGRVFATVREIARDREFVARPGPACRCCEYSLVCAEARVALAQAEF